MRKQRFRICFDTKRCFGKSRAGRVFIDRFEYLAVRTKSFLLYCRKYSTYFFLCQEVKIKKIAFSEKALEFLGRGRYNLFEERKTEMCK